MLANIIQDDLTRMSSRHCLELRINSDMWNSIVSQVKIVNDTVSATRMAVGAWGGKKRSILGQRRTHEEARDHDTFCS